MTYKPEYTANYWAKQAAALTEKERKWIIGSRSRRRANGRRLTNAEIGALIGKSSNWVSRVATAIGSRSRRRHNKPALILSAQDVALFKQMWTDGRTGEEIGAHWGYSEDWARQRAGKLGLPPRAKPITIRQVNEIKRLVTSGKTWRETAKALGVSYGTVARYAPRHQPRKRRGTPPKIDRGMADRMARAGKTHAEIAAYFGVSRSAVGKALEIYRKRLDELSSRKPKTLIPAVRPVCDDEMRDAA